MRKFIVEISSKKGKNTYNCSTQLTGIQKSLIMIIFDTPEKDLSNVEGKYDMSKVHTSSVNS